MEGGCHAAISCRVDRVGRRHWVLSSRLAWYAAVVAAAAIAHNHVWMR